MPRIPIACAALLMAVSNLCTSPAAGQESSPEQVSVIDLSLQSQRRVSRFVFEYGFLVTVRNDRTELIGLEMSTSSTAAATAIVGGNLPFGNVAAGAEAQSAGLLLLQQDRRVPFDRAALQFSFRYSEPASGALLDGDPALPAVDSPTTAQEVPTAPDNIVGSTLLDKVFALVAPDATIGEVNAALVQTGSRLAERRENGFVVLLQVPLQTNVANLQAVSEQLAATPAFSVAFPASQPSTTALPPQAGPFGGEHLFLSRFPAVFNALVTADGSAIDPDFVCPIGGPQPLVLIPDFFGLPNQLGPGYARFDSEVPDVRYVTPRQRINYCGPDPNGPANCIETPPDHGYDVVTTGFAAFDTASPTGAIPAPDCFEIALIPTQGQASINSRIAEAIREALVEDPNRRIVVNLSWGFDDTLGRDLALDGPVTRLLAAASWKATLREIAVALGIANLEENVLFVVAAGNAGAQGLSPQPIERLPGIRRAEYGNEVSIVANDVPTLDFAIDPALWGVDGAADAAIVREALLPAMRREGLDTDPPPANVIMVGSARTLLFESETPSESLFSNVDPDVFAAGEIVPTLGGNVSGTSFSTPQVSALAAAVWILRPELSAVQVKALIEATSRSLGDMPRVVDAYAALLATDLDPDAPLGVRGLLDEAPVRDALLDVNRDGRFDDDDLRLFLEAYFSPAGVADLEAPIVEPADWDWSRFDLNGDGFTGIDTVEMPGLDGRRDVAPFDLDAVFPIDLDNIQLLNRQVSLTYIFINPIALTYDENRVTDLDILCYYANTQLYRGDATLVRDLGIDTKRCLEWRFEQRRSLRVLEQIERLDLVFADVRVPGGEFLTLNEDIPAFNYDTLGSELTIGPPEIARFNRWNPFSDAAYGVGPGAAEFGFSGVRSVEPTAIEVESEDIVAAQREYQLSGCTAGTSTTGISDTFDSNPLSSLVQAAGRFVAMRVTPFSARACVLSVGRAVAGPVSAVPEEISNRTFVTGVAESPPLSPGDAYLVETQSGRSLIVVGGTDVGGACVQRPDGPPGYTWSAAVTVLDLQPWVAPDWQSTGSTVEMCGRDELAVIVVP